MSVDPGLALLGAGGQLVFDEAPTHQDTDVVGRDGDGGGAAIGGTDHEELADNAVDS